MSRGGEGRGESGSGEVGEGKGEMERRRRGEGRYHNFWSHSNCWGGFPNMSKK